MHSVPLPEAGSPRSRLYQSWFPVGPLSPACRGIPSGCVCAWLFHWMCTDGARTLLLSFDKDTTHIGLTLKNSFNSNDLFKDPSEGNPRHGPVVKTTFCSHGRTSFNSYQLHGSSQLYHFNPGDLMPSSAHHRHQGIMQANTRTHNSKNN